MQPIENMYPVGAIILERYLVEDILGVGGSSVVYLVQDWLLEDGQKQPEAERRFALKMLIDQAKQEQARFLFEAELLTRLNHPALPRIHQVFEEEATHHTCIVMDYVEGTNLDRLRKQRREDGYSLAEALVILAPVVEALSYLHMQPSPVIHRDIKPANLIVRKDGKGVALVDFGIAKEYELEATTTAIRHCSPGYAAPEQYSSTGTDQRTDIYGLAATLYVLLTNTVPIDALRRATKLASKEIDPLIPVNQLVPTLSASVAEVIHRAMSIDMRKRFSNVGEFWQALQEAANQHYSGASNKQSPPSRRGRFIVPTADLSARPVGVQLIASTTRKTRLMESSFLIKGKKSQVLGPRVLAALALLLAASLAFGLGTYFRGNHNSGAADAASMSIHNTPSTRSFVHTTPGLYPVMAQRYDGTMHDLLANVTMTMTLTHIEQNNEQIRGSFSGLQTQGTFTGVLDTSRHIFFTISGNPVLFFDGAIRSDGDLVGNYCTIDAAGQCVGHYGVWSFAPTP